MKNKVKRWEDIPKAKINKYVKKKTITQEFLEESGKIEYDWISKENKSLRILKRLYDSNLEKVKNRKERTPHRKLYRIICDKEILRIAYRKLSKNKGAMTPGAENITATDINDEFLEKLANELKKETFNWNPTKRIYIEKPGNKKKKRPLGINDFKNKIVQEGLRMILEAIYEPEFMELEVSYGFRPNKDCPKAIENIKKHARFANVVIEGDIVGAYNNVNHDKLFDIIKKRIKDKKLLKLIYRSFKAGIIEENIRKDETLGITQGNICSPILFNIYMHEFDKFMMNEMQYMIHQLDPNSNRTRNIIEGKEHSKLRKKINTIKNEIKLEKEQNDIEKKDIRTLINTIKENKSIYNEEVWEEIISEGEKFVKKRRTNKNAKPNIIVIDLKKKIKQTCNELQENTLNNYVVDQLDEQLKITTLKYKSTNRSDITISKILTYYSRYADDWTFWLRATLEFAERIKRIITNFLKIRLDLELSEEKIKITLLKEGKVKFLGFNLYKPKNDRIKRRKNTEVTVKINTLRVDLDRERIDKRFKIIGYYETIKYFDRKDKIKPREISWLAPFEIQQIIEKFNQFLLGFGNYYITVISEPNRISKYLYIMYYSCLKTLCTKLRISMKKLTDNYGYYDISDKENESYIITNKDKPENYKHTDLRICYKYRFDNIEKWIVLLNYKELMCKLLNYRKLFQYRINNNIEGITANVDYFSMYKVNFRTRYKMTSHCIICGSVEKPLHNHHIKKVNHNSNIKYKGYRAFDKVVASLNRKQITVCLTCHNSIHNGEYTGIKLTDLYDVRLAIPENYINISEENDYSQDRKSRREDEKDKIKFFVNERNKTYWNKELHDYFETNKDKTIDREKKQKS